MKQDLGSVGVIVVRFQLDTLHEGWKHLISYVQGKHEEVLVVLGVTSFPTPRNPLSFAMREAMVKEHYPDMQVLPQPDHPDDAVWSRKLDALISAVVGEREATLYGSRDSFIPHYSGRFTTEAVPEYEGHNATERRKSIAAKPGNSRGVRRGIIYAYETRLAVTRPMVDIAVLNEAQDMVLLGGKTEDPANKWRFPGGLVDPEDESLEMAAKREVIEETSHIAVDDFRYIGSRRISDWRYRGSGEGGITTLFRAKYIFGAPRPSDDLQRLEWIPLARLQEMLVEEHKPLGEMLLKSLTNT